MKGGKEEEQQMFTEWNTIHMCLEHEAYEGKKWKS